MKWALSKRIGIDLGTANSLVYVSGEGIVLDEPTVVAVSINDSRVLAVGHEAQAMLGRTPGNIKASKPMRDGVIADYVVTEAMLRYFLKKVGARKAYLITEPMAAAVGAGVPIGEASGNMILDMGGGTAEAAIISLNGVVVHKSVRVAGNKIDESISKYIRKKHNLWIGDATAERIKIKIGSALSLPKVEKMEVTGRDSVTGLPRQIEIDSTEVTAIIAEPLEKIVGMVKSVMEEVPPELSSDIIDKGIAMSGGTSLLKNFDRYLMHKTGVPVFVAEEPLLCVIKGTGIVLDNLDVYADVLVRST